MPGANLDFSIARKRLADEWALVCEDDARESACEFLESDELCQTIRAAINHAQVTYRFCLPTQLLGNLCEPSLDCLKLQKGKDVDDPTSWDARSLASKVVAPFNLEQEAVLGDSGDPYVSNPMRQPRMFKDDPSKKDKAGWNALVALLETVQTENDPKFTLAVFRQVLLEMLRRQKSLRFDYPVPLRVSLDSVLDITRRFLQTKSGGDRALAIAGSLFRAIGEGFGLYAEVRRGRINAADTATDQAGDIECLDAKGGLVLAVEVKDRRLTLADVEATLKKAKHRAISEIFFTAPGGESGMGGEFEDRKQRSFAGGQNLYVFDLLDLARAVLALGGEPMRQKFLKGVGRDLDQWNTQPAHRQAWQKLLAEL